MIEMLGAVATVCVAVVFLISILSISTANKVFFTTLILADILLISLFEAGIIFH